MGRLSVGRSVTRFRPLYWYFIRVSMAVSAHKKRVGQQKGGSPFLRRSLFDVPEVTSKDHLAKDML
jgi:hypothetical protein